MRLICQIDGRARDKQPCAAAAAAAAFTLLGIPAPCSIPACQDGRICPTDSHRSTDSAAASAGTGRKPETGLSVAAVAICRKTARTATAVTCVSAGIVAPLSGHDLSHRGTAHDHRTQHKKQPDRPTEAGRAECMLTHADLLMPIARFSAVATGF